MTWKMVADDVGSNPDIAIVDADDNGIIADIGGGDLATRQSHASLIAAAPDLLRACEVLLNYADKTAGCNVCALTHLDHAPDCPVEDARAAVAKAKGGA